MKLFPRSMQAVFGLALFLTSAIALARAGTSQIASAGHPVWSQPNWPKGLLELLNDPARADGWNDYFSEWPNDVFHYQYKIDSTDQVNSLLAKLAAIKSDRLHVRLAPFKEPHGFGWTSKLPAGNDTALMLSFGDQQRLDEWYGRLNGEKFGVMEFEKAPVAVPPTLTIFTRNAAIDLDGLDIPRNLKVSLGGLPGPFHKWNLKPRPDEPRPQPTPAAKLDPAALEAQNQIERIQAFLKKREEVCGAD
jgi:hypothetical protein